MFLTRSKIAMIVAEFLGTGVLTAVILAVSRSSVGLPYFVALAAGLVLVGLTMALGSASGAHFNPAITIGMWSARKVATLPAIVYVAAQVLGGIVAYLLYTYFVNAHWANSGHFESRVMVAEAVGAFVFSLGWAAVVFQKMEGAKAAALVGISLILGIFVASTASAGLLNPAVALGLRMWVWGTYVLGPILGAVIGFNLYGLLFAPEGSFLAMPAKKQAAVAAAKSAPAPVAKKTTTSKTASKKKKK
ncbi:MAG TPA: aquaporin [Candidatus Saccharimonadales bacterium]|nr:aquaporin [Candidatus Saccharimonadales bacterium]